MSTEEIQNIYDYSKSKIEICNKLGIRLNQNGISLDNNILEYFSQIGINSRDDISKRNLSKHWLEIQKRDYELNPKYCENCGKKLPFEKRFSKCCNQSCGSALGNKKKGHRSEETKNKIGKGLKKHFENTPHNIEERVNYIKKYYNNEITLEQIKDKHPELIRYCKECGKIYIPHLINSPKLISMNKYCSNECHKLSVSKQSKQLINNLIKEGKFKGWQSRNITSYPEKFWIEVLNNNNIEYKINFPIKQDENLYNYFLDFYININNRKIDLEIDGKQHKYTDRQESDIKRDIYIKSKGIEVYRIEWNEINSDKGKLLMKEKINKFLEYLGV